MSIAMVSEIVHEHLGFATLFSGKRFIVLKGRGLDRFKTMGLENGFYHGHHLVTGYHVARKQVLET